MLDLFLYIIFCLWSINVKPLASFSYVRSKGLVIVAQVSLAVLDLWPGAIIGVISVCFWHCVEVSNPVLIKCTLLYHVFSHIFSSDIEALQVLKQLNAKKTGFYQSMIMHHFQMHLVVS